MFVRTFVASVSLALLGACGAALSASVDVRVSEVSAAEGTSAGKQPPGFGGGVGDERPSPPSEAEAASDTADVSDGPGGHRGGPKLGFVRDGVWSGQVRLWRPFRSAGGVS